MSYEDEISEAFRKHRDDALREIADARDDSATVALRVSALAKGLEDALLVISRQIDRLASDLHV